MGDNGTYPDGGSATLVADAPVPDLVESDSLVEEISIDGMCGVY